MSNHDLTILGCSSQQPTRYRNHGAYLLRWHEEGILIDPGEGTQRQFIFANLAPTCVTRILISHFHGDHCLGLGSMLMRLNLDKVTHPIHCYYPASGQVYFDRLRRASIFHEGIEVVEHPVTHAGLVEQRGAFSLFAQFLSHGVDNIAWRITENDERKFNKSQLEACGVRGRDVRTLESEGFVMIGERRVDLDQVSTVRKGESFVSIIDTKLCPTAFEIAKGARVLLCESTYLEAHRHLAESHYHLTAKQAATIAKEAGVSLLVLTHFSARYQQEEDFEKEAQLIFPHSHAARDLRVFDLRRLIPLENF